MKYFDSHVHLTDLRVWDDREQIMDESYRQGCIGFLNAGFNKEDWLRQINLKHPNLQILRSFGLHPYWVATETNIQLDNEFRYLVENTESIEAIGETGLDLRKKFAASEVQQVEYFSKHIQLAVEVDLPLVVHCVRAGSRMLELLKKFRYKKYKGVIHSFSGSPEEAKEFVKLGFYISFSGSFTLKKAKRIRASASAIPLDKILVETDSPDQVPLGIEGLTNYPYHLPIVIHHLAEIKSISPLETLDQTNKNFKQLFSL